MALFESPLGADGFEFVVFTGADPDATAQALIAIGFAEAARRRSNDAIRDKQTVAFTSCLSCSGARMANGRGRPNLNHAPLMHRRHD